MKYAIISDIHSNLEALTVVLDECEKMGIDQYICLGDIVGYNANPSECLEIIRNLPLAAIVKGNHDEQASENSDISEFNPQAAKAIKWTREQLTVEQKSYLSSLPFKARAGRITAVHATLDNPKMWGYIMEKYAAEASFSYQLTQLCFMGHSHIPILFRKFAGEISNESAHEIHVKPGYKYLINVGSVGQPRDHDTRCSFATYDDSTNIVKLHRLDYDIESCQKKVLAAGLPERLASRLSEGR